ncbi:MAG: hypothetical protein INH41_12035 [Myxococcaceae bacterium]|jgi:hypothetical protein|nr:hypothetical protein [Myxococcaceae bacterium]
MSALVLAVLLCQAPALPGAPGSKRPPKASETAKLYFLAGDLASAREWCERGLKQERAVCKPFLERLASYAYLVGRFAPLTPDEAREVLALDRALSPSSPGQLTKPVQERYVLAPLRRARLWAERGAAGEAVPFVDEALRVDPSNVEAKALRARLLDMADGGAPLDGGR